MTDHSDSKAGRHFGRRRFIQGALASGISAAVASPGSRAAFNSRGLKSHYDFIVCGAGSAGCRVARRLAVNPRVRVLLLEAGGSDLVPEVMEGPLWFKNIGSERDWGFRGQPTPTLNGRTPPFPMGKVLGGGSSRWACRPRPSTRWHRR